MGTPAFALPSLKKLIDNSYTPVCVVTVPDKPAGRGRRIEQSPVKLFAAERNIPVLQPEKLKDPVFIGQLRDASPDLFVVVAFRILPPEVFTIPAMGAFNLHASLLPKYRGAAPINWAIINGETVTGVTTFFLKETVDTGSVILQARIPVGEDDTAGTVHDRLSEVGAEVVLLTVRLIENGKANPVEQDASAASPAPKIFTEDCRIRWDVDARKVHNFIRGLSPRPGAWTMCGETTLKIYRSKVEQEPASRPAGTLSGTNGRLLVAAAGGTVEILEIQQEGKKKLPAADFLRGFDVDGKKFS